MSEKPPKILITGGLGQAGMGIAAHLSEALHEITLVGRKPLDKKSDFHRAFVRDRGLNYESLDIYSAGDQPSLAKLAQDATIWVNAAEPYQIRDNHPGKAIIQMERLFTTALRAGYQVGSGKQFIRLGSPPAEHWKASAIAGNVPPGTFQENTPLTSRYRFRLSFTTPYFRTKRAIASLAQHWFREQNLSVISLAPGSLVGPYGYRGETYEILLKILKGKFPFGLYLPNDAANFVALPDLGKAVTLCIQKGKAGASYQLGGHNLRAAELADLFGEAGIPFPNSPLPKTRIPTFSAGFAILFGHAGSAIARLLGTTPPWWMIPDVYALLRMMGSRDHQKAREELGWEPSGMETLKDQIRMNLQWYHETGQI